jgi:hypothetical protein
VHKDEHKRLFAILAEKHWYIVTDGAGSMKLTPGHLIAASHKRRAKPLKCRKSR